MDINNETKKALAQIDGIIHVTKFAKSLLINTSDPVTQIWDRSHDLTYLTVGKELYISSDNALDTQTLLLIAMDDKWEYEPYIVTLAGTTPVKIHPTRKFLRCIRAENFNSALLFGSVYVATPDNGWTLGVPNNTTDIQAYINPLDQQTLMSHFTIPGNYWGLLTNVSVGVLNSGNVSPTNADIKMKMRPEGGIFLTKEVLPTNSEGTSYVNTPKKVGRLIAPMTDIHFDCVDVGRNDTITTCKYTLELYRKDKINDPIVFVPE